MDLDFDKGMCLRTTMHTRIRFTRRLVFILVALLIATALACSSCGTQESEPESAFSLSPELRQELERILDDVMAENGIPGAVIGVWVPGEGSWVEAKGLADVDAEQAMDIADKVRIGSITKTFLATVILQLVDEGRVSLDDPLQDYAPEVPGSEEITMRMLLDHTSGLFDYTSDEGFQEALDAEPLTKWQPQELVDFAISHEPYFAPGQGWQYSNTNYILLGMIVEQVTGNQVGDEMRTRIYERLGLSNTSFPEGPEMSGRYSHGYMYWDDQNNLTDITTTFDPSLAWAAGGMISNLGDLEVWAEALATGELLSSATQEERLTFVDAQQGTQYGLGIVDYKGFLGHGGDIPGFSNAAFYNPSMDVTIVLSLNKNPNDLVFAGLATFMDMVDAILASQTQ
jgi:D-alanyl-D-alanine carboxypeptidase